MLGKVGEVSTIAVCLLVVGEANFSLCGVSRYLRVRFWQL